MWKPDEYGCVAVDPPCQRLPCTLLTCIINTPCSIGYKSRANQGCMHCNARPITSPKSLSVSLSVSRPLSSVTSFPPSPSSFSLLLCSNPARSLGLLWKPPAGSVEDPRPATPFLGNLHKGNSSGRIFFRVGKVRLSEHGWAPYIFTAVDNMSGKNDHARIFNFGKRGIHISAHAHAFTLEILGPSVMKDVQQFIIGTWGQATSAW